MAFSNNEYVYINDMSSFSYIANGVHSVETDSVIVFKTAIDKVS